MNNQEKPAGKLEQGEEKSHGEIMHDFYAQKAISDILHISLDPIPLRAQLQRIIELLVSIPWLAIQGKGAIFLLDERGRQLEMLAQFGLHEALLESCAWVPMGHCLCGAAAKSGKVVFKKHLDEQHEIRHEGIKDHGHYCLPIIWHEKTLGVLNVYIGAGHKWREYDERFLVTAANTVGGIIERSMTEQELYYQKLAMDQHANISVVDADGKIIYVNTRFCESTGYSREELIGQDYSFLKSSRHPNAFYKEMWDIITSGEVWHGEICERSKDDTLNWSDATAVPFINTAGMPHKYITIRSDITARKLMEEEVAEKGIYLQNITNSMGDGVIAGDSTGKISFVNIEACSLLKRQEEELIGGDINDFVFGRMIDSELLNREGNPLLRALHGFQTYREENGILHRQDEKSLPIAYAVAPLIDDDGFAGSITVFRDITNRKRAEQKQRALIKKLQEAHTQLLQSEKMASIGQLAAGVAHEINNPVGYINSNLGSMRQYAADLFKLLEAYNKLQKLVPEDNPVLQELQNLEQELDPEFLKEDIKSLLEETDEGIHRVKQIVNDLKDFSRLDSTEWHWADLEAGLDSTLNIAHNEIKYNADVMKEYTGIPQIECIGSQLNQVFMNLLVNGAHAIEERGTITIRTGMDGDDWVWVEIADTGKGIKPEALSRIFDPFYTTKPVGKGTGLGLSLSYSIVERHGGEIQVESEVSKGTCFRVRLPVRRVDEAGPSSEGETFSEGKK